MEAMHEVNFLLSGEILSLALGEGRIGGMGITSARVATFGDTVNKPLLGGADRIMVTTESGERYCISIRKFAREVEQIDLTQANPPL